MLLRNVRVGRIAELLFRGGAYGAHLLALGVIVDVYGARDGLVIVRVAIYLAARDLCVAGGVTHGARFALGLARVLPVLRSKWQTAGAFAEVADGRLGC